MYNIILTSALQCLSYKCVINENLRLFKASQLAQRHNISSPPDGQCVSHT